MDQLLRESRIRGPRTSRRCSRSQDEAEHPHERHGSKRDGDHPTDERKRLHRPSFPTAHPRCGGPTRQLLSIAALIDYRGVVMEALGMGRAG
jgi:hypothetical protein